jgi:hypothetical protein
MQASWAKGGIAQEDEQVYGGKAALLKEGNGEVRRVRRKRDSEKRGRKIQEKRRTESCINECETENALLQFH